MPLVAFLATKINKEQHPHPHGVGGGGRGGEGRGGEGREGEGRGGKGRGGGQLPPPGKLNGFFFFVTLCLRLLGLVL